MSDDAQARFRAELDALVGKPVGPAGPQLAPDEVNVPMIRHWCDAMEDHNPVYTDAEFAARTRFKGIVAPPVMLQTWTMARPKITGLRERGGAPTDVVGKSPISVLDDAGFIATLATNSEFHIERYVRPGERISSTTVIDAISDEKKTAIGRGHFVTWITTYRDDAGEVVGRQLFRLLKFKPEAREGAPS
jgi:acyl dehydratase